MKEVYNLSGLNNNLCLKSINLCFFVMPVFSKAFTFVVIDSSNYWFSDF